MKNFVRDAVLFAVIQVFFSFLPLKQAKKYTCNGWVSCKKHCNLYRQYDRASKPQGLFYYGYGTVGRYAAALAVQISERLTGIKGGNNEDEMIKNTNTNDNLFRIKLPMPIKSTEICYDTNDVNKTLIYKYNSKVIKSLSLNHSVVRNGVTVSWYCNRTSRKIQKIKGVTILIKATNDLEAEGKTRMNICSIIIIDLNYSYYGDFNARCLCRRHINLMILKQYNANDPFGENDPNMYMNEVLTMESIKRCKFVNPVAHLHIVIWAVMGSWYGEEGMINREVSRVNMLVRHNDTKPGAVNYDRWTSEITTIRVGRYSKSIEDDKVLLECDGNG